MASEQQHPEQQGDGQGEKLGLDREDESQDFVDQSKIDFNPDEGLYTGTAVHGGSEIAGPHLDEGGNVGQPDADEIAEGEKATEQEQSNRAEVMKNASAGPLADEESGE